MISTSKSSIQSLPKRQSEDNNNSPLPNGIVVNIKDEVLHEISLKDFDQYRITKDKSIPQTEPTITWGGAAIAKPGNITGISAESKAGKTAFSSVLIAGAISQTGIIDGFESIEVLPNIHKKAVIEIDTEQSEDDQQYKDNTILKRAGFDNTPNYYRSYNILTLPIERYISFTDNLCDLCSKEYGGIHLILIDGGADYINSVNDEIETKNILQYFRQLSIKHSCPVIFIIHLNPNSNKERGHIGSGLQRKCYGLISITKEGDVSTAQPKLMRKAAFSDIPLLQFKYCKEKGYHVQVETQGKSEQKINKEYERVKLIASDVFNPPNSFTYTEAKKKIMERTKVGETTAKKMIENMTGWGFINLELDKRYRLKLEVK